MSEFNVMRDDAGKFHIFYIKLLDEYHQIQTVHVSVFDEKENAEYICAWLNEANSIGDKLSEKIIKKINYLEKQDDLDDYYIGQEDMLREVLDWINNIARE